MTAHVRAARRLVRNVLDAERVFEAMAFSEEEMANLNAIGAGLPVRGAAQILSALRLKADYLLQKPAHRVDLRAVTLSVIDPYSSPPEPAALARSIEAEALPAADRPRNLAEHRAATFHQQRAHLLAAAPAVAAAAAQPAPAPQTEPA